MQTTQMSLRSSCFAEYGETASSVHSQLRDDGERYGCSFLLGNFGLLDGLFGFLPGIGLGRFFSGGRRGVGIDGSFFAASSSFRICGRIVQHRILHGEGYAVVEGSSGSVGLCSRRSAKPRTCVTWSAARPLASTKRRAAFIRSVESSQLL